MMVTSHGNCCYHDFYQVFVSDETTEVISTSQTTDKQKGANLLRRTEERRGTNPGPWDCFEQESSKWC